MENTVSQIQSKTKAIKLSCSYKVAQLPVQPAVRAVSENESPVLKALAVDRRPRLLFRRTLSFGASGKDVKLLHELLNKDPKTQVDPQKLWSSGHTRDFFGSRTERAVQRFQRKYGIFSPSDEEYGTVGQKTIKKLRSLFGNGSFYLQGAHRLPVVFVSNGTEPAELQNISLGMGIFIDRVMRLFLAIFRYFFKGKPVFSSREYAFGSYFSIAFPRAKKSPLLRLFKESYIAELKAVEILVKNGSDQDIKDMDIESIVMGVRKQEDTLFILVSSGYILDQEIERLFRAFAQHPIIILPLGESDIARFEGWVAKGNINACLVSLTLIAEEMLLKDKYTQPREIMLARYQKSWIGERLDLMGDALTGQLRTLIKKLILIMKFASAGWKIGEVCELVHISRKTYYNWRNMDPAFRNIIRGEKTEPGYEFSSFGTSKLGNISEDSEDLDTSKVGEITQESP